MLRLTQLALFIFVTAVATATLYSVSRAESSVGRGLSETELACRLFTVRVARWVPLEAAFQALGSKKSDIDKARRSLMATKALLCMLRLRKVKFEPINAIELDGALIGYMQVFAKFDKWNSAEILSVIELYDKLYRVACKLPEVDILGTEQSFESDLNDKGECPSDVPEGQGSEWKESPTPGFTSDFKACYEDFRENTKMEREACGISQGVSTTGTTSTDTTSTDTTSTEATAQQIIQDKLDEFDDAADDLAVGLKTVGAAGGLIIATAAATVAITSRGNVPLAKTVLVTGFVAVSATVSAAGIQIGTGISKLLKIFQSGSAKLGQLCLTQENGSLRGRYRSFRPPKLGEQPRPAFLTAFDALEHCLCEANRTANAVNSNLLSELNCETSEQERIRLLCARDPYNNPSPGPSPGSIRDWWAVCAEAAAADLQAKAPDVCWNVMCPQGYTSTLSIQEGDGLNRLPICACTNLSHTPIPIPPECAEVCIEGHTCVCDGSVAHAQCSCRPSSEVFEFPDFGFGPPDDRPCGPDVEVPCPQ